MFFFWETTQEQLLFCIGLDRLDYMWIIVAMVCVLFILISITSGMGVLICPTLSHGHELAELSRIELVTVAEDALTFKAHTQ